MCKLCGCTEFIKQGKEAVLRRAVEIVNELSLTPENVGDYEETEVISRLIAPFGSVEDDVYQTAVWMGRLHMGQSGSGRHEQYQAHVRAFRDIFSRLPAKGEAKHIASTYHQLEQLNHELDDADLASLEPEFREAIKAVTHVHEDRTRQARLKERYGLQ